MDRHAIHIGSAGWAVPREHAERFAPGASHLARYATRFAAVEINSSFYHPHRPATYARWAAATPDEFRFAVKAPRTVTHERRLMDISEPLGRFFDEVGALGVKLGPVLVQLPPSLAFNPSVAAAFWRELRDRFGGDVVCEPRHPSWFAPDAARLLRAWDVARVAADPPPALRADEPAGWPGLRYLRLHGSPRRYYDAYDDAYLEHLAHGLVEFAQHAPVWCIFDNTAAGAATLNAFRLIEHLRAGCAHP
ncbi:MAG TPA: DUF72 domain-containing protein [Chloroflexota bacterium]|nr:DUF72 domain-containing protein [Chloroflexota bacterium]